MTKLYKLSTVTLLILFGAALTYGQHPICYYCSTYLNGEACNDPVNTTAIGKQNCSDFTIIPNNFGLIDKPKGRATTEARVCIAMSYRLNGELYTTRGCEFQEYDGIDACAVFQIPTADNYSCYTCTSDLCNSASSVYVPVAVLIFAVFASLCR